MDTRSPLHSSEEFAQVTQRVQDIIDDAADLDQAIKDLVGLGQDVLDVENGHLTQIEPAADYWVAIESTDQEGGIIDEGQALDLQDTYCRRVMKRDEQICLSHASEQGWADDPAYQSHELECYLGTPVEVNDEAFGTVCFVSKKPRNEPFSTEEQLFAEQLSFELGRLFERRRLETHNQRQQELSAVLGRILRHNLRNELTIIQGRAELLAAGRDGDVSDHLDPILDRARALETLANKSRDIEDTVSPTIQRQQINLDALITNAVEQVQQEYPDATFELDLSQTAFSLAPSIERALMELVENAAKHGGDPPVVTISTRTQSDAVIIEIADNGPGIPEPDRRVFHGDIETPLEHGSGLGLWIVSWIVDNHKGAIEVVDTDEGTRIRLRLPYTNRFS